MRAFTQLAVFLVFMATADCFPGFRRSFHPLRPYPPIESGPKLSGFPIYHMPIPTGIIPSGGFPTGTGFGPGPTGTAPGLPPVVPPTPTVPVGPTGQSSSGNSPTGISAGPGGQPSDTCPPVVPPTTVTVTVGGGGVPYPTGTGSLPIGTGPIVPPISPYYGPHHY